MKLEVKYLEKGKWVLKYEDGTEEYYDDQTRLIDVIKEADEISGDTYQLKEELKLYGFYWDPDKRVWKKSYSRATAAERKEIRKLIEYMYRKRVYETFDEFWEAECEGEYRFITKEEARQIWWEITHRTWDE